MANAETSRLASAGNGNLERLAKKKSGIVSGPQRGAPQRTDLTKANLPGANLSEADLTWATLRGASLSWVNLTKANLSAADLSEANLSGADLSRANLSGAQRATSRGVR
jgi:uncharacterized protein YjbI with pentapeptide repeats